MCPEAVLAARFLFDQESAAVDVHGPDDIRQDELRQAVKIQNRCRGPAEPLEHQSRIIFLAKKEFVDPRLQQIAQRLHRHGGRGSQEHRE